jgi:gamma-glutamyltranspeptidase/glutathione hydrolase
VRTPLVVSYYPQAQATGYEILAAGGTAADAYIAVTAVEIVLSPGMVTFSGLLGGLVYDAKTRTVLSIDAGNNAVRDPAGVYDEAHPALGKLVVVPGVVAGLDALRTTHGRMSWAQTLQPAIALAEDGFAVDATYCYLADSYRDVLERTEYGRRTFFPNGSALRPGEILRQPELAAFLRGLAAEGADYMYGGEWARQCVATVRAAGGLMTLEDLTDYRPSWTAPWRIDYRGHEVYATSGRIMHGLWTLLALKTLEHTTLDTTTHYSASADDLEIMVRIQRAIQDEDWIAECGTGDDPDLVSSRLTSEYTATIWERVRSALPPANASDGGGYHTLVAVTVDAAGNVVAGKHSVSSSWLWGTGLFVQGVSLNASGELPERYCGPGARRTQGAPNLMAFKDGTLRYACGVTGGSGPETAFQLLVNAIDYGLPEEDARQRPRFGQLTYDESDPVDPIKNLLSDRVSPAVIQTLRKRGLRFVLASTIGNGFLAEFGADGSSRGGWTR